MSRTQARKHSERLERDARRPPEDAGQYTELTRRDRLVRRDVAVVMSGLPQSLELERKRVPGEILYEADRLESLFFAGYDPHFEGDEPPGL